ncbi:MAG: SdrD B-like domain-containing protein [Trichloromonas sp.]|jgi:hypothetical protein|nr:SdrD B-like domain-containing protein [Trichloromonas sp.]
MPQKRLYLSWFLFLLCCLVPAVAGAGSLIFNDAASGPVEVSSLDWVPGNSLADEALPLGTDPNAPTRFTQGYQAVLGNFLDGNGNVITGTGLNVSYEITIVASYGQIGARSPLDIDNDGFVEIENSNFDLDASANVNFVEIYLDTNRNANSLTGTGYRDGIPLMKGVVSAATGQFSARLDANGDNILDLKALDQFLTNNYVGTGTISGAGSSQLTVQIDSASVNSTCFPGVGSSPLTLFFNTSLVLPYYQQNPSAAVAGIVPELGPASGGYSRVNGLAALDSAEQTDMLFQADANSSISLGPCIDIVKEVSVDGGLTWFDANTLEDSPGTTDGAIYRFIVSNCSSVTLTDVTITDPNLGEDGLPLILDLGDLDPEASVTVEPNSSLGSPLLEKPLLCADVPPPGNEDPIKFNLATVVGTVIGTNTTVEDSDPAYVRCLCVDIEKLVSVDGGATFVDADQCVDPAAPIATGAVEYKLVVSNCGAAILDDVRVVDSLLGIDESVGSLVPEQVITYDKEDLSALLQPDFCALFGDDTAGSQDIDNTATVTATAFNRQFDLSDDDSACVTCLCTGSIGDFVWNDLDRDGIQDANESGIGGVTVTLLMGGETVATTTTDADGAYLFSGLCAGDYTVTVATPDGYMPSPSLQGGDAALDSNGSPADVALSTDNSSDLTIDFGFYPPCTGSIGDFVWNDTNNNGVQDAGEMGIAGVKVELYTCTDASVATTFTDANGYYSFTNLMPGDYYVKFYVKDGFAFSSMDQGGDDAKDSDADPATGKTVCATLTPGENDLTWDAGMYTVACTPLGTGTPGYWMNHPEAWPVDSITIGGVVYSKDKAILLMKSPVKLDKTYTMLPALVSAKLNVLVCSDASCIAETIAAADDWMRVYGPVGSGVRANSKAWKIGEPLYLLLDKYNNGLLCAPSRDAL